MSCEKLCIPQLFVCEANACKKSDTGLSQAMCEANCGHALRGTLERCSMPRKQLFLINDIYFYSAACQY